MIKLYCLIILSIFSLESQAQNITLLNVADIKEVKKSDYDFYFLKKDGSPLAEGAYRLNFEEGLAEQATTVIINFKIGANGKFKDRYEVYNPVKKQLIKVRSFENSNVIDTVFKNGKAVEVTKFSFKDIFSKQTKRKLYQEKTEITRYFTDSGVLKSESIQVNDKYKSNKDFYPNGTLSRVETLAELKNETNYFRANGILAAKMIENKKDGLKTIISYAENGKLISKSVEKITNVPASIIMPSNE